MDQLAEIAAVTGIKTQIINPAIKLLLVAGLVIFLWGLVQFVIHREDSGKAEEGKKHMVWGLVGLAVIVSAFGLVNLLYSFVGKFG